MASRMTAVEITGPMDGPDALVPGADVARVGRHVVRQEALARTLRIEAPDALQAGPHGRDAQRDQGLGVVRGGRLEFEGGDQKTCRHASVSPARSGLSRASPKGTSSGSRSGSRRSVTVPRLRGRP